MFLGKKNGPWGKLAPTLLVNAHERVGARRVCAIKALQGAVGARPLSRVAKPSEKVCDILLNDGD